jgi:hypothetical protein
MSADPALLSALADAIRNAGATEGIVAALLHAGGTFEHVPRSKGGRPRKYRSRAECDLAYRARRKLREKTCEESRDKTSQNEKTCEKTPTAEPRDQIACRLAMEHLRGRLRDVCQLDPAADLAPIVALINQGCDLEADVVPVVARLLPDLPRPLKNWGATWLVREILAARDQRLHGLPPSVEDFDAEALRVDAPPPLQRTPAIEWDEFVGGYRAGLIQWNAARLGPKPGEPGCRAPAKVLREHGFRP